MVQQKNQKKMQKKVVQKVVIVLKKIDHEVHDEFIANLNSSDNELEFNLENLYFMA